MSIERAEGNNYEQNRRRVIEIYEQTYKDLYGVDVDLSDCSCHHIVFRSDVKHNRSGLTTEDNVNRLANLYPFSNGGSEPEARELQQELHASKQYHDRLHFEIGRKAYETEYKPQEDARRKTKIIYLAPKSEHKKGNHKKQHGRQLSHSHRRR